jgi:rRNA maturation endonuclease Nob1
VNFCPVCKREYREMGTVQTRHCPVCGSALVQISENELNQERHTRDRQ